MLKIYILYSFDVSIWSVPLLKVFLGDIVQSQAVDDDVTKDTNIYKKKILISIHFYIYLFYPID